MQHAIQVNCERTAQLVTIGLPRVLGIRPCSQVMTDEKASARAAAEHGTAGQRVHLLKGTAPPSAHRRLMSASTPCLAQR
jgi:hypothetical protein